MGLFLHSVDFRHNLKLRRCLFGKDFYLKGFIPLSDFRLFIFRNLSNVRDPLHFFSDKSTNPFTFSANFSIKRKRFVSILLLNIHAKIQDVG